MLLDSNIIIYSAQPDYKKLLDFISIQNGVIVSIISKIEVLGYHKLTDFEKENFQLFFNSIPILRLSDEIVDIAIELRQRIKISLGDSIIAATALQKGIPLITNNTDDFKHIEELELITLDDIIGGKEEKSIPME
ncbi:MAG TPA: type II toxin-antitoxin system VapC family toxin [Chitinophagales bacterium]|nr:type II toxin-antitoxin system VapC family toxin [Chitinophagales bacterium]